MSLTGANSAIFLGITDLYDSPQQLQGFAADDIFDTEMVKLVETLMGVDGKLSGGFVHIERKQTIALQADSPSNDIFDNWAQAMEAQGDTYEANGVVSIYALGQKFTLTTGFLTGYTYMPAVKKLIQPRKFEITWNKIGPAPV
jgi:hypothetical protein